MFSRLNDCPCSFCSLSQLFIIARFSPLQHVVYLVIRGTATGAFLQKIMLLIIQRSLIGR